MSITDCPMMFLSIGFLTGRLERAYPHNNILRYQHIDKDLVELRIKGKVVF